MTNNKIDIALINETKLKKIHKISFNNYQIIRNDRAKGKGGGTAIIVSNKIPFKIIQTSCQAHFNSIEITIIKISISNNRNLFVIIAYAPGNVRYLTTQRN